MSVNSSHSFRAVPIEFPIPPIGFQNIPPDTPGKYVFGAPSFRTEPTIFRIAPLHSRVGNKLIDDITLGFTAIFLIAVISECVLTCMKSILPSICSCFAPNCDSQRGAWKQATEGLQTLLGFRVIDFGKKVKSGQGFRRGWICVVITALIMIGLQVLPIIFSQEEEVFSKQFEYNLKGSHPIGADLGLGKFLRRNAMDRPCVTPVFEESNIVRNFSISTCHFFDLKEAHKGIDDRISSVRIGSWFHDGGSDHRILFGNASIKIKARAFVFGIKNGTWRLLFPTLNQNHTAVTRHLHQIVIFTILNESCHAEHSTKSCAELFAESQMKDTPVTETIRFWLQKENGPVVKDVDGLETTLEAGIQKPWPTIFQKLGPLMTTELIEEVEGPGTYSHISSEEREEGIPGLVYQKRRKVGVFIWLIVLGGSALLLFILKLWQETLRPQSNDNLPSDDSNLQSESA